MTTVTELRKITRESRAFPIERIRNIGIIAHIDAGKTTATEMVLFHTGQIYKAGQVDDGTTQTDWMKEERQRGITIVAAAISCQWLDHKINIIDTPGHVDFTAEVERSLRVLDGGVVIFDAVAGVEAQSETVWHQANRYNVPRICFVNKMDRPGANYWRTIKMMEERLGANPVPVQLPLGTEDGFRGIIDLVENKALLFNDRKTDLEPKEIPIPDEYQKEASRCRETLIEKIAEIDDEFMEIYLKMGDVTSQEIKAALRRATLFSKIVPVLCGSARRDKGIQPLLDAVVFYLPSPLDVPPIYGIEPKTGKEIWRRADDKGPLSALAFKVVSDPFIGRLLYLRIYSGTIRTGSQVLNLPHKHKERIGRLLQMHANRREEITEAYSGDIVAAIGLKDTFTGDTLCNPQSPIVLESIRFPEPVVSVAIEPRTKADQDKIGGALAKLEEEDPTFKVSYDEETGQTIVAGMGELHLDIISSRLISEFGVQARVGKPRVAYKETITVPVTKVEGRFIKQTGGRGQYGQVWLKVEPLERGSGFEFVDKIRGATIPKEFIPAVERGAREAAERGVLAGYSLVDIRVILYDGSYHEVDSSEIAFKMAGSIALRNGVLRAKPVLLEPVMKMEVTTPQEFLGDIIGDLNARRGHIIEIEPWGNTQIIHCNIPLAETFGYVTNLRSLSQGRASFYMEFYRYEEVPRHLADEIIARDRGWGGI